MFGATIPVAVFAGVLGGIMGAPVVEYVLKKLPGYVHPAVENVTSMTICTIVIAGIIQVLPWF